MTKIYQITIEAHGLELKQELVASIYSEIDSRARKLSNGKFDNELRISMDAKDPFRIHIVVTEHMAQSLISALQEAINNASGIGLRSHLNRLQELLMAEMFADARDVIQVG